MKQFYIDEKFLTDVTIVKEYGRKEIETKHDLVNAIKNPSVMKSISHQDHPEFTKFREQLESDGYIEVQRMWCNGDRVLKPFKLNDFTFRKGAKFCCAAALGCHFAVARKYNHSKTIGY